MVEHEAGGFLVLFLLGYEGRHMVRHRSESCIVSASSAGNILLVKAHRGPGKRMTEVFQETSRFFSGLCVWNIAVTEDKRQGSGHPESFPVFFYKCICVHDSNVDACH